MAIKVATASEEKSNACEENSPTSKGRRKSKRTKQSRNGMQAGIISSSNDHCASTSSKERSYSEKETKEVAESGSGVNVEETRSGKSKKVEVRGSKLTYFEACSPDQLESEEYHFVGIDIRLLVGHASNLSIKEDLYKNLTKRSEAIAKKRPEAYVLKCCSEIARRMSFLKDGKIHNEAEVQISYGNPIVEMLCEFFGYKLTLEDSMNDRGDLVTTSEQSKADYVIYTLMKDEHKKEYSVCAVIIEVKHCKELNKHFTAQIMGYYCKAKQGNNQSGFAMLLNEFDNIISAKFFLFPYKYYNSASKTAGYCLQSLMLPTLKFTYDEIIDNQSLIQLILLLADMNADNPVVSLECPPNVTPIIANQIIEVYTDDKFEQKQLKDLGMQLEDYKRKERKRSAEVRKERAEKERIAALLQAKEMEITRLQKKLKKNCIQN